MEVFQHYQYLTEVKNESGEWHKTTQTCVKAKHIAEDMAHVWERGGLPHRQAYRGIVIAVLDRAIRIKKKLFQSFDVSCCLQNDKEECDCEPECQVTDSKKMNF